MLCVRELFRIKHVRQQNFSDGLFQQKHDVSPPLGGNGTRSVFAVPIDKVRVSSGSAIVLGLADGFLNAKPTTAYLLTYINGKCTANCVFCPQAKGSVSRKSLLSRVTWPVFATKAVVSKIKSAASDGRIKRVCIQALNYPTVSEDLSALVRRIRLSGTDVPISVSCQPLKKGEMQKLAEIGVERIGISLDAATKEIFERVKGRLADGPYDWASHHDALVDAVTVFGKAKVSTHLIVGLGESERDITRTIQWCVDNNVFPSIFSFTPIRGTVLEANPPPALSHFRRVQLAHHLMEKRQTRFEEMSFNEKGCITYFGVSQRKLKRTIRSGKPFLTSGCPNCNRPYYNEKPSGPIYNFPMQPTLQEVKEIEQQLME